MSFPGAMVGVGEGSEVTSKEDMEGEVLVDVSVEKVSVVDRAVGTGSVSKMIMPVFALTWSVGSICDIDGDPRELSGLLAL